METTARWAGGEACVEAGSRATFGPRGSGIGRIMRSGLRRCARPSLALAVQHRPRGLRRPDGPENPPAPLACDARPPAPLRLADDRSRRRAGGVAVRAAQPAPGLPGAEARLGRPGRAGGDLLAGAEPEARLRQPAQDAVSPAERPLGPADRARGTDGAPRRCRPTSPSSRRRCATAASTRPCAATPATCSPASTTPAAKPGPAGSASSATGCAPPGAAPSCNVPPARSMPSEAVALTGRLLEADPLDEAALRLHLQALARAARAAARRQAYRAFVARLQRRPGPGARRRAAGAARQPGRRRRRGRAAPPPVAADAEAADDGFVGRSIERRRIAELLGAGRLPPDQPGRARAASARRASRAA